MPFGQPLFIVFCAGSLAVIVIFTAPVWARVYRAIVKLLNRQMSEAGEVLDQPFEDKKEEN